MLYKYIAANLYNMFSKCKFRLRHVLDLSASMLKNVNWARPIIIISIKAIEQCAYE